MLFEKRQQITIFVIGATLVAVFVLLWYLPTYRRLKALKQAKYQQTVPAARLANLRSEFPALRSELLKLQEATDNCEQQIPGERGLGEFLHGIADLMNEHNLKEQQIQPGEEIKSGDLYRIPIDMKCKGRLAELFEFYKSLQGFDRLVRIEQVKLINDSGYNGQLSMQTKASIYYRTQAGRG
jgi:Tfp pilus assembly protein PilO